EQAGHRVRGAGAGGGDGHAELAGRTAVAIGGVESGLFVADGDGRNTAAAPDGVVDGQVVDADDAEDILDAERPEGFVDGFAAGHFAHGSPVGEGGLASVAGGTAPATDR